MPCRPCVNLTLRPDGPASDIHFVPGARDGAIELADRPQVSIVIATHNRRDVLVGTLHRLASLRLAPGLAETIVVDNASADGTADSASRRFSNVRVIELNENLGSCAKALGVDAAQGRLILFLDDDSYPRPGSIEQMIDAFEADHRLGAAGFIVHLPDGRRECSALPNVFVGCGVGLRADALAEVGGLDRSFFMQAEEYDLSFRLVAAGWSVETLPGLHVDHLKTRQARISDRTIYYDTRNNLLVAARYLPDDHAGNLRDDWTQRYRWLAERNGQLETHERGRTEALAVWNKERLAYATWRLTAGAFEQLFRFDELRRRIESLARTGASRVVFAGLGKNVYPFFAAAQACGLDVLCIGDDQFAGPGRSYRGVPIVPLSVAAVHDADAIIISDTSPVHAGRAARRAAGLTTSPVHCWFGEAPALHAAAVHGALTGACQSAESA